MTFQNDGAAAPRRRFLWLGQSARTTVVTRNYPELASARWMASLGDAIHRPRMLDTVFGPKLKERLAIDGPLMLDSGGFTLMMRNGAISLRDVARVFSTANADVVISLDHPPLGSDTREVREEKYVRTLANYEHLHSEIGNGRLAPVVHGTSVEEIERNCAGIRRIEHTPAWVCLGGQVPLLRQSGQLRQKAIEARRQFHETVTLVRQAFPGSRLHVLGVGAPRTIAAAFEGGADSVDSVGWRRAAGFGTIFMPGGTERFVSERGRKRANSRLMLTDTDLAALAECKCPACRREERLADRLTVLAGSYLARAAHNASVLIAQADRTTAPASPAASQSSAPILSSVRDGANASSW